MGTYVTQEVLDAMADYPLASEPDGVKADYEHRVWHGHPVLVAAYVCIPLMVICSCVRLYAKIRIVKRWTLEDYVFCAALPGAISYIVLACVLINDGAFGYHAWEVHIKDLDHTFMRNLLVLTCINGPISWLVKSCLLCLFFTAFRPLRYLRILCIAGIVVMSLFYIISATLMGVACRPMGGTDRLGFFNGQQRPSCSKYPSLNSRTVQAHGIFNVISDLYILVIPIPAIIKLALPRRRKIGVLLIFSTGGIACIMSILGLYYRTPKYIGKDVTYREVPLWTVMTIELAAGIMIPCMTIFAKFYQHVSPVLTSLVGSNTSLFRSRRTRSSRSRASSETDLNENGYREDVEMKVPKVHDILAK